MAWAEAQTATENHWVVDFDGRRSSDEKSGLGRKDKTGIVYNENVTLKGIPEEALDYQVNGKSALELIIERYQVTTHKASLIRNDPNDYSREIGNPRYIMDLIKRIVTVSLETNHIVKTLPALEIIE